MPEEAPSTAGETPWMFICEWSFHTEKYSSTTSRNKFQLIKWVTEKRLSDQPEENLRRQGQGRGAAIFDQLIEELVNQPSRTLQGFVCGAECRVLGSFYMTTPEAFISHSWSMRASASFGNERFFNFTSTSQGEFLMIVLWRWMLEKGKVPNND